MLGVAEFSLSNYISAEEACGWTGKREAALRVAETEQFHLVTGMWDCPLHGFMAEEELAWCQGQVNKSWGAQQLKCGTTGYRGL